MKDVYWLYANTMSFYIRALNIWDFSVCEDPETSPPRILRDDCIHMYAYMHSHMYNTHILFCLEGNKNLLLRDGESHGFGAIEGKAFVTICIFGRIKFFLYPLTFSVFKKTKHFQQHIFLLKA
jgi:hypothetical protein